MSAHLTLAQLSHKGKVSEAAMDNYQRALTEEPWLWEAFIGLCDLGKARIADYLTIELTVI